MNQQAQLTLKQIEDFIRIGNSDPEALFPDVTRRAGFDDKLLGEATYVGANGHREVSWQTEHGIILFKAGKLSLLTKPKMENQKPEPLAEIAHVDANLNLNSLIVPLESIIIKKGFNARSNSNIQDRIIELVPLIQAQGQMQAISVIAEGDHYVLTHGECRLRAMVFLKLKTVKVNVLPNTTTEQDIEISQLLLNDGKPLNLLEQGEVYARLEKLGMDNKTIAKRTGYSVTHVRDCKLVATAPEELKESVAKGEVSASAAKQLVKSETSKKVMNKENIIRKLEVAKAAPKEKTRGSKKITGKTLTGKATKKREPETIGMSTNLKPEIVKAVTPDTIAERALEVYSELPISEKEKKYSASDVWNLANYILYGQGEIESLIL